MRQPSTNWAGQLFTLLTVEAVWAKGQVVSGYDPRQIRKDACGAWIRRSDYGRTDSQYGWEIDHVQPVSRGGTDNLSNLQPLRWENNRTKGDNYPHWSCAIKAA